MNRVIPSSRLHVALIGPPGSGKGTQARRLVQHFGLAYVETGELLRQEAAQDTPEGREIKAFLDAGHLVPLSLVLKVVERFLATVPPHQGIVFDGIPRSLEQALMLEELLRRSGRQLDAVILLSVPEGVIRERLARRGRPDDTPQVITERLKVYAQEIPGVVDFYRRRGILHVVDGVGTPDEVFERVKAALAPFLGSLAGEPEET